MYIHGTPLIENPEFMLNKEKLLQTVSLIHLGQPIGNQIMLKNFSQINLEKLIITVLE